MSTMEHKVEEMTEETRRLIGEHPLPSALTAFGVGLGVGLLAITLLPASSRERDEAFTQKMFDALSRVMPDAVSRRMS